MPYPPGGVPSATSGDSGWSIPAGSRHIEDGWSLITYLTSKAVLLTIASTIANSRPARTSLQSDPFYQNDPIQRFFFEALKNPRDWGEGPWGAELWDILPLAKPALAAVAIFHVVETWSDFFGPYVYLVSDDEKTISAGLPRFLGIHSADWTLLMAASATATFPMILKFFFAQRIFIQGVVTSGFGGR
jgi:hypothetical protein